MTNAKRPPLLQASVECASRPVHLLAISLRALARCVDRRARCSSRWADGYLARKEGKVSKLGIYMDAAIDKIFVLAGLIALTDRGLLPVWMVLVIMFRDTLMGGLRSFAAAERVIIPANQWGKFKTTISWLALIAVILQIPHNYWVMMLFVVMAVISGFIYFYQSRDIWLRSLAGVPVQQIVEEAK